MVEGEAGGLMVTCDALQGRRAYMKPRRKTNTVRRAAREKIASDLAHDLDVCVPPVILGERREAGSEETHVAVSLVMFPRQDSWEIVRRALERQVPSAALYRASMPHAAARAWAFDTWLGQGDHKDESPDNIIFGYDPKNVEETGCFVFLDYAFSMGHLGSWDGEKARQCEPVPFPTLMRAEVDRTELGRAIDDIESYDEKAIEEVVYRVPVSHLDGDEKEHIVSTLKARRTLVRPAFEQAGVIS